MWIKMSGGAGAQKVPALQILIWDTYDVARPGVDFVGRDAGELACESLRFQARRKWVERGTTQWSSLFLSYAHTRYQRIIIILIIYLIWLWLVQYTCIYAHIIVIISLILHMIHWHAHAHACHVQHTWTPSEDEDQVSLDPALLIIIYIYNINMTN